MQCVIHADQEALDACRACGKPICSRCGEESAGAYVCARCREPRTAPADDAAAGLPLAPPTPAPRKSPWLAALLSMAVFPGLGQAYNGQVLKAVSVLSLLGLLLYAAVQQSPQLAVFVGVLWLYQVFEAFWSALAINRGGAASSAPPSGRVSVISAWLLVAGGLVLFLENLTGWVLPRLPIVLPALVILGGLLLLYSYLRAGEEAQP